MRNCVQSWLHLLLKKLPEQLLRLLMTPHPLAQVSPLLPT